MKYSIEHVRQIVQGTFAQFHENDFIEQLLTDSRKLIFPETTLFFGLQGPRRGGAQFAEDLYKRGVRNFVLSEPPLALLPLANILVVRDPLEALQQLSAYHREQFELTVIGITGSNGKTMVKEWLNQLLQDRFHIVRSPRSYNSQIGVPLSVWQINEHHELGLFEAGISKPGEMHKLASIIHPDLGIITNIGEAHGENFSGPREKTTEKISLFDTCQCIFYPADDVTLAKALQEFISTRILPDGQKARLFGWGRSAQATLVLEGLEKGGEGSTLRLLYQGIAFTVYFPFSDEASIANVMTCLSVLLYFNTTPAQIVRLIPRLSPIAMRLELKSGINHCSVINDSYSADFSSLKIALDFLAQQSQHRKQTVILSDILQSGRPENELYKEVAQSLRQKKVQRLIGIGDKISAYQDIFNQAGIPETSFYHSAEDFKKEFHHLLFREETILIKGARIFEFEIIDRLLSEQVHQTVLEINLDAMAHNLRQFQQLLRPSTRLMAMVKAFSYGSGSYEIAGMLQFHQVDYLAVAYTDEGVELRKAGIHIPIMVMNTEENAFDALVQYNLEPVIYSTHLLKLLDGFLRKEGLLQFPVHIELETGMNRLGFPAEELDYLTSILGTVPLKIQSVFSHLAASEESAQDDFSRKQAELFEKSVAKIRQATGYDFIRHMANTAAIIRHPEWQYDMVRLGIGLYGIDSAGTGILDLKEVSTLKSTITQIKHLREGDTVGYNRKGLALQNTVIATVRIGYADGYPRTLGNGKGKIWVRGHFAPVAGSICMDMLMIDITGIPGVQEGDEVIVFGHELSVTQVAHDAGTIPYEILTGISQRVKRIYYEE